MSDMDEFKDTYFQECDELLGDLEEHFIAIEQGQHDGETLHAVFRAIHSIKGGAGAFGFEALVGFSHSFESFLDLLRDEKLALSPDIIVLCHKANDIVSDLVASARSEEGLASDFGLEVEQELKRLSEVDAVGEVFPSDVEGGVAAAKATELVDLFNAEPLSVWRIDFKPHRALFERANEPLLLFRELSELGSLHVKADVFNLLDFVDFDPMQPCVSWVLTLETRAPRESISEVFEFVDLDCDLDITLIEDGAASADMSADEALETEKMEEDTSEPVARAGALKVDMSAFMDDDDDDDDFSVPVRRAVIVEEQEAAPEVVAPTETKLVEATGSEALGSEIALSAEDLFPADDKSAQKEGRVDVVSASILARDFVENNHRNIKVEPAATMPQKEEIEPKLEPVAINSAELAVKPEVPKPPVQAVQSIRVDLDKVDRVVNMVGELVITQAMLTEQIDEPLREQYTELVRGLEILAQNTRELQDSVMAIRAQPVKSVFARMPRLVRELAMQTGKKMRLVMVGEATEIDKTVIEQLADPLTHMIRNSADHGIEMPDARRAAGKPEEGTIRLSAAQLGGKIVIKIMDDGAGVNREKVLEKAISRGIIDADAPLADEEIDQLIFAPGFSTADTVSSLSGRGVGMDVVRENINRLGGRVSVKSRAGEGAYITLTLPLTLAVLDVMLVRVGEAPYVLPLASIIESIQFVDAKFGELPNGQRVLRNRGEYIPVIELSQMFGFEQSVPASDQFLIVCELDGQEKIAILVDTIMGQQQVVIKSLEENFERLDGISGATILGDGRVALILDVIGLKLLADTQKEGRAA